MEAPGEQPTHLADFLLWEDEQELRFEFDGTEPIARLSGTAAHAIIQSNLMFSLGGLLRDRPCQLFGSGLKIVVAGSVRYPDAFVVCRPVAATVKVVRDPTVVFEIMSESSAIDDLVVKNAEYRATSSIRRYVVIEQNRVGAAVFVRKGDDWIVEFLGKANVLNIPEIDVAFPLRDIYADLGIAEVS